MSDTHGTGGENGDDDGGHDGRNSTARWLEWPSGDRRVAGVCVCVCDKRTPLDHQVEYVQSADQRNHLPVHQCLVHLRSRDPHLLQWESISVVHVFF